MPLAAGIGNHRVLDVKALRDGEYELTVITDPGLLSPEITLSRRFTVDSTQPRTKPRTQP
ncbi:hypothetical protein [Streptomyces luteogriseus]|uniref:hypothetical protein n=1 Tax=Streptomyces luteogriseus TaxID=68233 RepID=UPI0036928EDE